MSSPVFFQFHSIRRSFSRQEKSRANPNLCDLDSPGSAALLQEEEQQDDDKAHAQHQEAEVQAGAVATGALGQLLIHREAIVLFWVDIAVVEVGMGGRLDSTNVINPLISVITNIGFDHTQFLGTTLPAIAGEKAGIIKPGVPVVIGQTHPETQPVFRRKADEQHAPIFFADQNYRIDPLPPQKPASGLDADQILNLRFTVAPLTAQAIHYGSHFVSPLSGSYQLYNLATLFQTLQLLPSVGLTVEESHIRDGIARVVADTGLHGRWEQLDNTPLTICETAHNADGIEAMLGKLRTLPYSHLHLIYGCVNDKDYAHILRMLPTERTTFYYSQPSVPRGLPVAQLAETAAACGLPGEAFPTVGQAIAVARAAADPEADLVLVTGSIFLVADAVEYYSNRDAAQG